MKVVIGKRYFTKLVKTGETVVITARLIRGQIVEGDDDQGREYNCPAIALVAA